MPREIGIGLIGFGWMGEAHSRSYRAQPMYFPEANFTPRLVAVAEPWENRRTKAVTHFGFEQSFAEWQTVIEHPEVEVVDITAPTNLHQPIAQAAAVAGKTIFCEKPVGDTPETTLAICAAAETAGVLTGVGYNYRWTPLVQWTRQLIHSGRLGQLTHYRGRFFSMYGRDRLGVLSWRFIKEQSGYGVLMDLMSHVIDLAHFLVGPISAVISTEETFIRNRPLPPPGQGGHYSRGSPDDPTGEVTNEDYVGAMLEFASGARGVLEVDRSIVGPQSQIAFELNGTKGAATWDHEYLNQLRLYLPEESPTDGFIEVLGGDTHPHQASLVPGGGNSIGYEDLKVIEAYEFLSAVHHQRPYQPGFAEARQVALVQAAMVRSWQNRAWEPVESA